MRAAVLHAPGPPSVFSIEEIPKPLPGRGDVLVQVLACGVSFKDVVERNGTYRRDMSFPIVIGVEISGTVVARGEDVAGLEIGDTVCTKAFSSCGGCRYCRSGRETTCLQRRPVRGGYGEYAAIAADACVRLPPGIPPEVSCSLGAGAGVALNAVRDVAGVRLGETVLVTGASGGVGSAAIQIAKLSGARVIAVTRSDQKKGGLIQDGADEIVVASSGEDFSGAVRALTEGEGVDVVIDAVGSRVFNACFDSLALHGRYAMVGQLYGEDITINPARIFFKRARLLGVGSVSRAQLEDVVDLIACGRLRPRVAKVLPLADIALAHRMVENGEASGRVVINPQQ
jgi:NADPH:quinone reductase-like Zn-dependent oxidoreductase